MRTDVTAAALTGLLAEIADLRARPVPAAEFADVKRAIVGSFALALENPSQVLGYYLDNWQYGLPDLLGHVSDARDGRHRRTAQGRTLEIYDADGNPMK